MNVDDTREGVLVMGPFTYYKGQHWNGDRFVDDVTRTVSSRQLRRPLLYYRRGRVWKHTRLHLIRIRFGWRDT